MVIGLLLKNFSIINTFTFNKFHSQRRNAMKVRCNQLKLIF